MEPETFRVRIGTPKSVLVLRAGSVELAGGRITLRQGSSVIADAVSSDVTSRRTLASLGTAVDLRISGERFKVDFDSTGGDARWPFLDLVPFIGGIRRVLLARRQAANLVSAVDAARLMQR